MDFKSILLFALREEYKMLSMIKSATLQNLLISLPSFKVYFLFIPITYYCCRCFITSVDITFTIIAERRSGIIN